MPAALRIARRTASFIAALTLAACASSPSPRHEPPAAAVPSRPPASVGVPPGTAPGAARVPATSTAPGSPAVPPASPSGTWPVPSVPSGGIEPSTGDPSLSGPPATPLTPGQFADLFDRIRSGFVLPDDSARRAIDQQLDWYANNPDYLERAFARAELYLYHIVTEIESRGMPLEIALLPVVESAFEPYAYSGASASGLWQFIPGTGSRFGLKSTWWYDGRRDVVESTRAALDYLQFLHDEFNGDWLLAIAAYNCGEMRVAREVAANAAAGRPVDFWSLRLPSETRAYVPKLLAMRRLVANPGDYGLAFSKIANQPYFARLETHGQIDLRVAAELAGVSYEEVYELNPAFHRFATDPEGPHWLLLPLDAADIFRDNLSLLSPDERMRVSRHHVRAGDSVSSVARRYSTSAAMIRELNGLPSGPLVVGSDLRVPSGSFELPVKVVRAAQRIDLPQRRATKRPTIHVVRRGDTLYRIAKRHNVDVRQLARMNGMRPGDTLRAGQRLKVTGASRAGDPVAASRSTPKQRSVTYTVRNGDTLSRISRLYQVSVAQIVSWNGLASQAIRPGQKITIRQPRH